MYNIINLPDSKISHIWEGISVPLADKIPKLAFFQQFWEKAPGQNWGKMIRVLTRILKIELKMLFARKKNGVLPYFSISTFEKVGVRIKKLE